MNLKPALIAAAVLACAACGSSDSADEQAGMPASTSTAAAAAAPRTPLDYQAVKGYESELLDKLKPCPASAINPDFNTACLIGVEDAIELLEEFDTRTPMTLPKTRAATITAIADLEYWRDTCPTAKVKAADRQTCIRKTPIPGKATDPMWEWYAESGNRS